MTIILWISVALLTVDAGLISALLFGRLKPPLTNSTVTDLAPLIVLAGVLTALISFVFNLRRNRSEDILDAATDLFDKAYSALTTKDGELTNRRHSWLSAARLIATAERLSAHLSEASHTIIYREKREYWRSRLYDLIFPSVPEGLPSSFYADKPEHMIAHSSEVRDPLSEKSLAYMYRFIQWPQEKVDPIGETSIFTDIEIEKMRTFGPRGLGNLIAEARRIAGQKLEKTSN